MRDPLPHEREAMARASFRRKAAELREARKAETCPTCDARHNKANGRGCGSVGREQLAFWRAAKGFDGFVYVMQGNPDSPVKMGWSRTPAARLVTFQTGNPETLHLRCVLPGPRTMEGMLQSRFEKHRVRGEWFDVEVLPRLRSVSERMIEAYRDGDVIPRVDWALNVH